MPYDPAALPWIARYGQLVWIGALPALLALAAAIGALSARRKPAVRAERAAIATVPAFAVFVVAFIGVPELAYPVALDVLGSVLHPNAMGTGFPDDDPYPDDSRLLFAQWALLGPFTHHRVLRDAWWAVVPPPGGGVRQREFRISLLVAGGNCDRAATLAEQAGDRVRALALARLCPQPEAVAMVTRALASRGRWREASDFAHAQMRDIGPASPQTWNHFDAITWLARVHVEVDRRPDARRMLLLNAQVNGRGRSEVVNVCDADALVVADDAQARERLRRLAPEHAACARLALATGALSADDVVVSAARARDFSTWLLSLATGWRGNVGADPQLRVRGARAVSVRPFTAARLTAPGLARSVYDALTRDDARETPYECAASARIASELALWYVTTGSTAEGREWADRAVSWADQALADVPTYRPIRDRLVALRAAIEALAGSLPRARAVLETLAADAPARVVLEPVLAYLEHPTSDGAPPARQGSARCAAVWVAAISGDRAALRTSVALLVGRWHEGVLAERPLSDDTAVARWISEGAGTQCDTCPSTLAFRRAAARTWRLDGAAGGSERVLASILPARLGTDFARALVLGDVEGPGEEEAWDPESQVPYDHDDPWGD